MKEIAPELYGDYSVFLSFIDFGYNKLEKIPENFFKALPNLVGTEKIRGAIIVGTIQIL